MANIENLIPFNELSESEHRRIAHNGGVKSGEVRKARKTLREELLLLLEDGDTQKNITIALLKKAENGDIQAFKELRDTIGEKPIEKTENNITIKEDKLDEILEELK